MKSQKANTTKVKKIASTKSTGGGGYTFEDRVSSYFLALMLSCNPPLDTEIGLIEKVDFQTRVDGWLLDDILLTMQNEGETHRCSISIKSNEQFDSNGAPNDFVLACWQQYCKVESAVFDADSDFMAFVTAPLSPETKKCLEELVRKAKEHDSESLPEKLETKGWVNEIHRTLFNSFACPEDLASRYNISEVHIGNLLARLRFLSFDFENTSSFSKNEAIRYCQECLRSGNEKNAELLWAKLLEISSSIRSTGGSITHIQLLDRLRSLFDLKDRLNHQRDWDHLLSISRTNLEQIVDNIGAIFRLDRSNEVDKLNQKIENERGVIYFGESGIGKSAIVKAWTLQQLDINNKVIWFDAGSFERKDYAEFQKDLDLTYNLDELFRSIPDRSAYLVIDGLDCLHNESGLSIVKMIIGKLNWERELSPWHVVVTCKKQELDRIYQILNTQTIIWSDLGCEPISDEDLSAISRAFPKVSWILGLNNLKRLLINNLKMLDTIVLSIPNGKTAHNKEIISEISIAELFMNTNIEAGPNKASNRYTAELIATKQADDLRITIPLVELNGVEKLPTIDSFIENRICNMIDGKISFTHELYGDWIRLVILMANQDTLDDYLVNRVTSPLWHRAIRLYGQSLVEKQNEQMWKDLITNLSMQGNIQLVDLLLESAIYLENPEHALGYIKDELFSENGFLLKRLLNRFLAYATHPDPLILAIIKATNEDNGHFPLQYRKPEYPYWVGMLRFIYKYHNTIIELAPFEVAKIVEKWLDSGQKLVLRKEMAEIGIELGKMAIALWKSKRSHNTYNERKLYYRAALLGADKYPDEISRIALEASERYESGTDDSNNTELNDPLPKPWENGPYRRVDKAFRDVVINTNALHFLFDVNPATAREVVLAVLIQPPKRSRSSFDWIDRCDYHVEDILNGRVPAYIKGPFLGFLNNDFKEGINLIIKLVEFATKQNMRCAKERNEIVILSNKDFCKVYLGGMDVFGWSSGLGNPPTVIVSALMALEQHLYMKMDNGLPVEEEIVFILNSAKSIAFLAVLVDVGKKSPSLFESSLLSILFSPEIIRWDISRSVSNDRHHLMIGREMYDPLFMKLVKAFNQMKHRNIDLRQIAGQLVVTKPHLGKSFSGACVRLEQRMNQDLEDPYHDMAEQCVLMFNRENYVRQNHPEYGPVLLNEKLMEYQDNFSEDLQQIQKSQLMMMKPIMCRQLLDGERENFHEDSMEQFWSEFQLLAGAFHPEKPNDWQDYIAGGICGSVAVLFRIHKDWIERYPERKEECFDLLCDIIKNPPETDLLDSPTRDTQESWDCFAAEILPELWIADPNNQEIRKLQNS